MVKFSSLCHILCIGSCYVASAPNSGYVYKPDADAWLRLHMVPANWADAGMRCYLEGGMLASPTITALANVMHNLMSERQIKHVFTGINSILSMENFVSLDGVAIDSIPLDWANGEPNNANNDELCVALTGAGALEDVSCKRLMPYFCSKVNKNKCGDAGNETCYVASTSNPKYEYQREAHVWLRLYDVPTTWANAGMRCTLEGGVLASPTTNSLAKVMQHMMTERRLIGSVFTGINTVLPRATNYTSVEGVPLASTSLKWAVGEPDNAGGAEDCVALTGAGELADVSCEDELPYFCRRKNKHKCGGKDNGYEWEPRTGSCYKFHRDATPWLQAVATCHAEGGHLAIINSDVESTVLKELFEKNPSSIITADDTNYASIGFWEYNNNLFATVYGDSLEAAGFNKWSSGEPSNGLGSENCGSIHRDGLLNDVRCESRTFPFICECTPPESE